MTSRIRKIATLGLGLAMTFGLGLTASRAMDEVKAASTYTWSATSADKDKFPTGSGTATLGAIAWTYSYSGGDTRSFQTTQASIQMGSQTTPMTSLTLTATLPSSYGNSISSISVESASYNATSKLTIKIGGVNKITSQATSSWTTVSAISTGTLSPAETGEILLSWAASSRAFYLKSITIVGSDTGGGSSSQSSSESSSSSSATVLVSSIALNKQSTAIANGSNETLSVSSILPADASDKTYSWSSTDNTVASVNSSGLVTANKLGTATIVATANDGSAVHGDCTVTVVSVLLSSFSALSGDIDSNISYATYKGGAGTAPALYEPVIRLYQGTVSSVGGYITISADAGYKISAFTTTTAMATSLDYSVENATTWSGTKTAIAINEIYSKSGLNCTQVSIGCFGTTSGTRYYVSSIGITYAVSTDPTIAINSVPLNVNVGASGTMSATTANSGGALITWSSDNACLTVNSTTGAYTANSIGTAHVTASMTVNSVEYTSIGSVNISGPATISECISISTAIGTGNTTAYKVTVGGTITSTATDRLTITDGGNSLLIYGTYSPNNAATKAWIINGTISFTGYVQNFGGTAEIVSPLLESYTDGAITYATNSNLTLDAECTALSVTPATWATLAANYDSLDANAKARLAGATSTDANSAEIGDFFARYILVVKKYGYTNFMNVTISPAANIDSISDSKTDNSIFMIFVIAALGLTAVTAYSIGKKKEEQA